MPNLVGKNLAEANARVALVGVDAITQFDIGGDRSCAIDLILDNQLVVIEKGQICQAGPNRESRLIQPKNKSSSDRPAGRSLAWPF